MDGGKYSFRVADHFVGFSGIPLWTLTFLLYSDYRTYEHEAL